MVVRPCWYCEANPVSHPCSNLISSKNPNFPLTVESVISQALQVKSPPPLLPTCILPHFLRVSWLMWWNLLLGCVCPWKVSVAFHVHKRSSFHQWCWCMGGLLRENLKRNVGIKKHRTLLQQSPFMCKDVEVDNDKKHICTTFVSFSCNFIN